jgi:hypothetical protein
MMIAGIGVLGKGRVSRCIKKNKNIRKLKVAFMQKQE